MQEQPRGGAGGSPASRTRPSAWRAEAARTRGGNMAAAEPSVAALAGGGVGAGAPSGGGGVPVLFCFSVFARPASVPHGAGYDVLIQKFLSLYGDQLDMHRKFVVQLFAEEWGQYVDLPKGFAVSERCKLRLVPLQIQVGPAPARPPARPPGSPPAAHAPTCVVPSAPRFGAAASCVAVRPPLLSCSRVMQVAGRVSFRAGSGSCGNQLQTCKLCRRSSSPFILVTVGVPP